MGNKKSFEDFQVFKDARYFVKDIYSISFKDHSGRDFALQEQMRRAVISIVSNIAEGFERGGDNELRQYLSQAKGSAGEVRAQLILCCDLGYIDDHTSSNLRAKAMGISRQISGWMRYLKSSKHKGNKFKST